MLASELCREPCAGHRPYEEIRDDRFERPAGFGVSGATLANTDLDFCHSEIHAADAIRGRESCCFAIQLTSDVGMDHR